MKEEQGPVLPDQEKTHSFCPAGWGSVAPSAGAMRAGGPGILVGVIEGDVVGTTAGVGEAVEPRLATKSSVWSSRP